jgi:hypothetical protein
MWKDVWMFLSVLVASSAVLVAGKMVKDGLISVAESTHREAMYLSQLNATIDNWRRDEANRAAMAPWGSAK